MSIVYFVGPIFSIFITRDDIMLSNLVKIQNNTKNYILFCVNLLMCNIKYYFLRLVQKVFVVFIDT